jgi:8-oxo-dGTP pyrophosphatase MutT (NUDIX family)
LRAGHPLGDGRRGANQIAAAEYRSVDAYRVFDVGTARHDRGIERRQQHGCTREEQDIISEDTGRVDQIQTVATREIYRNNWLTLREDDIRRPDGSGGVYAVIDKPAYALVIPQDGDRFHLVEQFRYPLGLRRWEFPQGTAPDQEHLEPMELAARELREETGLRASGLAALGQLDVAPGMSSQRGWVFLATGITEGEHEREHEEQDMHSEWFSRAGVERMIREGEITDAQTIAAWALLLLSER